MKHLTFFSTLFATILLSSCNSEEIVNNDEPTSSLEKTLNISDANIELSEGDFLLNIENNNGQETIVNLSTALNKSIPQNKTSNNDNIDGKLNITINNQEEEIFYYNYNPRGNKKGRIVFLPREVTEYIPLEDGSYRTVEETFTYNNQNLLLNYNRTITPPDNRENLKSINQRVIWNNGVIRRINQRSIFADNSREKFNIIPRYNDGRINTFLFKQNNITKQEEVITFQPNGDVNYKQKTVFSAEGTPSQITFNQFYKDNESNIKTIETSNVNPATNVKGDVNFTLNVEHENRKNYAVDLIATSPFVGLFIQSPEFYSGRKNRKYLTQEFTIPTGDVLSNRIDARTKYNAKGYPVISSLESNLRNVTKGFSISSNQSTKRYRYTIAIVFED
ncbi:hypothetical protein [Tenacibaculum sp. M341]|uniref:hypothetical protein n=1 Tax=Tenacibaculum sp. M341 TaxID=2530339 RepID=UPI00104E3E5B|nr:hypothetical protein [Tenacibaculum sp. M341]TCI93820.1 hypothetical protein EYW44_05230 [Tenacibaculum sp. M341]